VTAVEDNKVVNVGVVGAGYFGTFHAQKYRDHPQAKLVGVVDPNPARVVDLASAVHAAAFTEIDDLVSLVDAVTVASPATTHFETAQACLKAGKHVLLEKPITVSVDEADELLELAAASNLLLQPGHQERYVMQAIGLMDIPETPVFIECRRAGPFTGRAMDCDVTLDMMIHDLDFVHALNAADIASVKAEGLSVHTPAYDRMAAQLLLEDGCEVELFASRIHDDRERIVRVIYPSGEIALDFGARTVINKTPFEISPFETDHPDRAKLLQDPLAAEVGSFLEAVKTGNQPLVTAENAQRALQTAVSIIREASRDGGRQSA